MGCFFCKVVSAMAGSYNSKASWMFPQVSVGSRFFFFNELRQSTLPGAAETLAAANNILGQNLVSSQDQQKNIEQEQNMQQALNFLRKAVSIELANEKQYYQEKLFNNPQIAKKYRDELKDLVGAQGEFDYYGFMRLLKQIELGETRWKKSLEETKTQLKEFNNALIDLNGGQQTDIHDEYPTYLFSRLFRETNYGKTRTRASDRIASGRIRAISSSVLGATRAADIMAITDIVKRNRDKLLNGQEIVLNNPQNIAYETEMSREILAMLYESQEKNQKTVIDENVVRELLKFIDQNEKLPETNPLAIRLMEKSKLLLSNLDILEQEGQNILPQEDTVHIRAGKNGDYIGLTKDIRKRLALIFSDDPYLVAAADKNFKRKTKSDNRKNIISKKEYIRHLVKALERGNAGINKQAQEEISNILNKKLNQQSRLTISAHSEYSAAFDFNKIMANPYIKNMVIGGLNGKADIMSIDIGEIVAKYGLDENTVVEILNDCRDIYEKTYEEEYNHHRAGTHRQLRDRSDYLCSR